MTDSELVEAMRLLGVSRKELRAALVRPEALDILKKKVRTQYRKVARSLHPDVNGGDEAKTALFQAVAQVCRQIQALTVAAPVRKKRKARPVAISWRIVVR